MKLFNIENGQINVTEELLIIPEFKAIWEKHKDKEKARKEFLYVYFYADYSSSYKNYDDEERAKVLSKDYDVVTDNITNNAITKYKEMSYTFNMKFLDDCLFAANKTREYFRNVDYNLIDAKGNLVYKGTDVTKMLKDTMGVITSLETLRSKVEAELVSMSKLRGGGNVSKREYGNRKN